VALAAMVGSAIEWYDFFIYLTAAALVFGPLFFPGGSELAGVLAAFSTAAVGFVARPIGGRRPTLRPLRGQARPPLIAIALSIAQFFLGMMYGPQAALFAEMFSARVRYSGASIGYQGASVFAGGLAPVIMVSLLELTGTSLSVSIYVFIMSAVTFFSVYLITATYGDEMTRDQVGAREEEAAAT
jgi:MFS family permease